MRMNEKYSVQLFGFIRTRLQQQLRQAAEQGEGSSLLPIVLWAVASWIHDCCTRPLTWRETDHWGEDPAHRRQRGGRDWILFSSGACADATLLSRKTVRRAVRELIRLGLVESYLETERPRSIRYRNTHDSYDLEWFGPRTQVVRIVLEPPRRAKSTSSWAAS